MTNSEIFDRALRRKRRDRAAHLAPPSPFLDWVTEDVLDRVASIDRPIATALVCNAAAQTLIETLRGKSIAVDVTDPGPRYAAGTSALCADEDRLVPAQRYDLAISIGLLDTVHDVPGALVLLRRLLNPDGVAIVAFAGAGSLETLRAALRAAEPDVQRTHPMIDVRNGGDLLARAGFVLPVADADHLDVRYRRVADLVHDLRAHAATNTLAHRHPLRRATWAAVCATLEADAPFTERLTMITLTGWAPSQQRI